MTSRPFTKARTRPCSRSNTPLIRALLPHARNASDGSFGASGRVGAGGGAGGAMRTAAVARSAAFARSFRRHHSPAAITTAVASNATMIIGPRDRLRGASCPGRFAPPPIDAPKPAGGTRGLAGQATRDPAFSSTRGIAPPGADKAFGSGIGNIGEPMPESDHAGAGTIGDSGDSDNGAPAKPSGATAGIGKGAVLARAAIRNFALVGAGPDAGVGVGTAAATGAGLTAGGVGNTGDTGDTSARAGSATVIAIRLAPAGAAGAAKAASAARSGPIHGESLPASACTKAWRALKPAGAPRRT